MHKHKKIVLFLVFWAVLGLLGGALSLHAVGRFSDEEKGLEDAVNLLPPDWQTVEDWQDLSNLPELLLIYQGRSYEPLLCNHSWAYQDGADYVVRYNACGADPRASQPDCPRLPHPTAEAGEVLLVWQAQPSKYQVWAYDYSWLEQRQDLGYGPEDMPKCQITPPENILRLLADPSQTVYNLTAEEGCQVYEQAPGSYLYVVQAEWYAEEQPELGGTAEWAFFVE